MQSNVTCDKQGYFRVPTFCVCGEDGYGAAADSNLDKCKILIIFLSVIWEGTSFTKQSVECLMDWQI